MHLDRRGFTTALIATLGSLVPAGAAETTGLFWTATAPGKPTCTLFGYARTAAAVTQDIIKDGDRYVATSQRLVVDIPNVQFPPVSIPLGQLQPILPRVSAPTAQRLRGVLGKSSPSLPTEKLTGIQLVLMLRGEGQTPPQPSVGGTIAEHALAAGKPIAYLITPYEMKAAFHPPDLLALDQRVDEKMLLYLLGLRDIVGPLGKFAETLYIRRRTGDLASADADMARHNVPGSKDLIPVASLEPTMINRAVQTVRSAPDHAFLMLPIGILTQDRGILSTLRRDGVQVDLLS